MTKTGDKKWHGGELRSSGRLHQPTGARIYSWGLLRGSTSQDPADFLSCTVLY